MEQNRCFQNFTQRDVHRRDDPGTAETGQLQVQNLPGSAAGSVVPVEGTHPPIVDGETFRRAARLLERRGRADGSGRVHPLSGLVVCGDCGRPMTRTANGSGRVYLRCRGALDGGCSRHGVALDALTQTVVERLARRLGEDCRDMTENLQSWEQTPALRETLACAVERVAVWERDETGRQPVELWWRF